MQNNNNSNKFTASDAFINAGTNSINNTVRRVIPRASYNPSYYRRRKNMLQQTIPKKMQCSVFLE